jgi:hypothetical protein
MLFAESMPLMADVLTQPAGPDSELHCPSLL